MFAARLYYCAILTIIFSLPAPAAERVSFHAIDAEPLGHVSPGAIVLHDGWRMREEAVAGEHGKQFSDPGFQPQQWYATSVPITVLGALVRAGIYPDPYVGRNNERIPDASEENSPWRKPWWFRRNVEIPAAYAGKTVWLHLDGINYRADVWVNGEQVADERSTVGMFRRFRFDITRMAHAGKNNAMAIRIFPVDVPGKPGYRTPGSDPEFQRNVTEMAALGWDWVGIARDRNMGIWQHVWIESSGEVALWDPAAFTDVQLPGGRQASVTLRMQMENASAKPARAELLVSISRGNDPGAGMRLRKVVEVDAHSSQEVVLTPSEFPALRVRDPLLWWPHGYGGQPLYDLAVEARVNGKVSHRQVSKFGFRKVGYFYRPAEFAKVLIPVPDGEDPYKYPLLKTSRVFTVNGREIRMAGGSMVPDFLLTWNAQRYRDEARMMVEGNHSVVRIWGGGIIAPDAFYDEADRRGLLVWQDLARSSFGSAWRKKEADLPAVNKDLYLDNMRDVIARLRGTTSLLAWCGTNEGIEQTDIGEALQNEILPAMDGTRPWIPSTSTEPPWANEPLGMRSFGPYQLQDLRYYFDQYANDPNFLFRNELGSESSPRYNSILETVAEPSEPAVPGSWVTQSLLDHGLPYAYLNPRLTDRISAPAGLADFMSEAELLSAQALRAIYDAAAKVRPRNPGTLIWMTNAAWPDFMYALYDWHLHPTAGYYAVKAANKPLHVQYSLDDRTIQVVSTLLEKRPVRIHAIVMSPEGKSEEIRDYKSVAVADGTAQVGPAPAAVGDGNLHFLSLDLRDADGTEIDRLVTWTQAAEKWRALANLPPVSVTAKVVRKDSVAGESRYRIVVRNTGKVPAVHVWVEVDRGSQGREILPSYWSDNALTMLPGETRELTVRFRTALLGSATPKLMVEGFNVTPREVDLDGSGGPARLEFQTVGLAIERAGGRASVKVVCSQKGAAGPRWTTWPVRVTVDGRRVRYFRVAVQTGKESTVDLPLDLSPGVHRVQVGERSIDIPARAM